MEGWRDGEMEGLWTRGLKKKRFTEGEPLRLVWFVIRIHEVNGHVMTHTQANDAHRHMGKGAETHTPTYTHPVYVCVCVCV